MATFYRSYPGNLALEEDVWTLSIAEAKAAATHLNVSRGTYWESVLLKPTRRAVRAKQATVRVYTAGFSTGELSNVLALDDASITRTDASGTPIA